VTGSQFPWDARCTCGWKGSELDALSYFNPDDGAVTECPRCHRRTVTLTPRCWTCGWRLTPAQTPRNYEHMPRVEILCSGCHQGRHAEDQAEHTGIDLEYYYETPLGIALDDNPVEGIDY
jgi:hypothetical protein